MGRLFRCSGIALKCLIGAALSEFQNGCDRRVGRAWRGELLGVRGRQGDPSGLEGRRGLSPVEIRLTARYTRGTETARGRQPTRGRLATLLGEADCQPTAFLAAIREQSWLATACAATEAA